MAVIGDFTETDSALKVMLLKLSNMDLMKVWKRCGITANYGANYISVTYPGCRDLENSASMILNELLENAAKYSAGNGENIEVEILVKGDSIVFTVENELDRQQYEKFTAFVSNLMNCSDLNELYMKKLTSFVENSNESGIGLLTIMNYYNPKMGYQFTGGDGKNNYRVSVQAAIPVGR